MTPVSQIDKLRKLLLAKNASFYKKPNKLSDDPVCISSKKKGGPEARSFGYIDSDESKWFTHPELKRLYASRQAVPDSFDAKANGNHS